MIEAFLKNTQTLTGSKISIMVKLNIFRKKPECQDSNLKLITQKLTVALSILVACLLMASPAEAIIDPLTSPNNKFGIHLISGSFEEASEAAQLVNSSGGDWGYVTILIESKSRDLNRWQNFFDELRRKHLIPIVRLATEPQGNFWKRPPEGEEEAWAQFLDSLNWPSQNRYVVIYNEPNQAQEWGNAVDAKSYAAVLEKVIVALKSKNSDFFVLNAGFDASAPHKLPSFEDQLLFMRQMEQAIPGIFNRLDGWVSHSYPNPNFVSSPQSIGRGSVRTWLWELQLLRAEFKLTKNLPIFITETGWKHAEGINYDKSLPPSELVGSYFHQAFSSSWNSNLIIAVTPFLLNYQESPFDHFSFKKLTGQKQDVKILGVQYPNFYPQYQAIVNLPKIFGKPVQENKAQLIAGEIYSKVVAGETYQIPLTFKNIGQSIWNDQDIVRLTLTEGAEWFQAVAVELAKDIKIEPGSQYTFNLKLKAPPQGRYRVVFNLFSGDKQFDSSALEFTIEVKQPVILVTKAKLKWKKNFAGLYKLQIIGTTGQTVKEILLGSDGLSDLTEAKFLLPDYQFDFVLSKPFYKSKKIAKRVFSGPNELDFSILEPDLLSALLNPEEFWKLLPFSK